MKEYFKKNQKFIELCLFFLIVSIILAGTSIITGQYYEETDFFEVNILAGSLNFSFMNGGILMLVVMAIPILTMTFTRKPFSKTMNTIIEGLMFILLALNIYAPICILVQNGGVSLYDWYWALGYITNIILIFYWIQTFAHSDSVVKSKKDNDLFYFIVICLVLTICVANCTYFFQIGGLDIVKNADLQSKNCLLELAYTISTGITYIFFAKVIENYQDELVVQADAQKEVRVEAGKKAAKTRKVNEGKTTSSKKTTSKKTSTKKTSKK